ncbi:MAG: DnaJ domain-containing protein [Pseudomonadota bacterium]
MLQSCQRILTLCREGKEEPLEWLQQECVEHGVQYPYFLQEAARVLELFQSDDEKNDNYEILGLSPSASFAEVKSAYRKLTVLYHPDTAGNADKNTTERFIEINKAYHSLCNIKSQESIDARPVSTDHSWHYGKTERATGRINKKIILWSLALILVAVLISSLIAQIYSQKVMIAALQKSSSAFVPPAKKSLAGTPAAAMTFAEKMKIAETNEKDRQAVEKKESSPAPLPAEISTNQPEQKIAKETIKTPVLQPPETKKEISTTKNTKSPVLQKGDPAVHHEPAAIESKQIAKHDKPVSVPTYDTVKKEIEAQISIETRPVQEFESKPPVTQLAEEVKKTPAPQVSQTKTESSTTKPAAEAEKKKHIVATAENTKPPVLKKDVPAAQHEPAAIENKDIATHDKPATVPTPTYDTVKKEIETQLAVQPAPAHEPPKVDLPTEADMQQRIDSFVSQYCRTYGEKNFVAFSRFFEPNATENNVAFTELVSTYTDLFKATRTILLQISTVKWEESPKGQILLNGRFQIDLVYQNAESVQGQGTIEFLLTDDHGQLLVQKMDYAFDQ